MPHFDSLFELSLETIAKFKPSQLCRHVASESTDPPEVQYEDEFYDSLLFVTFGNICISPEYASAKGVRKAGRIDFFIPIVKWGIKITQEGDRLLQHVGNVTGFAMGLPGVRVGVQTFVPPKNPYLCHGYTGLIRFQTPLESAGDCQLTTQIVHFRPPQPPTTTVE